MGMSGSGKTTFRNKYFKNIKVLDLWDFQDRIIKEKGFINYSTVWQSYVELKKELLNCVDKKEDILVEHTLLKSIRREFYISDLKKRDTKIIGYYVSVDKDTYLNYGGSEFDYESFLKTVEVPSIEEGFDELYFVKNGQLI